MKADGQQNKLDQFLKELTVLCRRYGFKIDACGCCDSPWVVELDSGKWVADRLRWDWDADGFVVSERDPAYQ